LSPSATPPSYKADNRASAFFSRLASSIGRGGENAPGAEVKSPTITIVRADAGSNGNQSPAGMVRHLVCSQQRLKSHALDLVQRYRSLGTGRDPCRGAQAAREHLRAHRNPVQLRQAPAAHRQRLLLQAEGRPGAQSRGRHLCQHRRSVAL
jgi:hypothetical protein